MAHAHGGGRERDQRQLLVALLIAALTAVLEVVGGALTGSLALLADAAHVWGDAGALLLALLAIRMAARPHSLRWTFGFHRAEVLAASLNGLALLLLAVSIGWRAAHRLAAPEHVHGTGLLVVALAGLVANGGQLVLLRHGHSLNMRAARLHVLSDLGGSIAAVVAGVVVTLGGDARADPIASLLIVGLVLAGALRLLAESGGVLMARVPSDLDLAAVERALLGLEGVRAVHDVHAWAVSSDFVIFDCHIQVAAGADAVAVVGEASAMLRDRFGLTHVTIQPERAPLFDLELPE